MATRVNVVMRNRLTYFPTRYPYDRLIRYFSFSAPGARFSPLFNTFQKDADGEVIRDAQGKPLRVWDGRIKLLQRHKLPTGLFRALKKEIEDKEGIKFKIVDERKKLLQVKGLTSDREYQNECVDAMCSNIRKGGGLVLNATSTGKTYITAMFCSRVVCKVLFIVNTLDLLEQARTELQAVLKEPVGYVGDQTFKPERVTVATIQTLRARSDDYRFQFWLNKVPIMILDEVHEMCNRQNFDLVRNHQPLAVFGLTATLQLKKKEVRLKAFSLCGPVLYNYPISAAVSQSYLTAGIVFQCLIDAPSYKEGRYHEDYNRQVVESYPKKVLIRRLVKYAYKQGKYILLLVRRPKHVKMLSKELKKIPHMIAWGGIDKLERKEAVSKIEKGKIRLIIANQVFKKGITIKRIDLVIDAAEMKSKNDAIQKYGRATRLHPSKQGFIYIDLGSIRNRFEKAAKSRYSAFRAERIPITRKIFTEEVLLDLNGSEILAYAEVMLKKELKKHDKREMEEDQ